MAILQYLMHQRLHNTCCSRHKLGPLVCRLREPSCGAQMLHVTQRRDRPRVYLYILCSWVYQHVSLCLKLNRFWLIVWSCCRRGESRDRSLSSLVMQQYKHAQSCGRWGGGWASLHYPVPSFSIQLKLLDDPDTTAFRRKELFLLYLFLIVFSLRPPASPLDSTLLISSPRTSAVFTSLQLMWKPIPLPGKTNVAAQQQYTPVL